MTNETLEQAAKNYANEELSNELTSKVGNFYGFSSSFTAGAKWQAERMFSEEEVETIAKDAYTMGRNNLLIGVFNKWFEQFKNK